MLHFASFIQTAMKSLPAVTNKSLSEHYDEDFEGYYRPAPKHTGDVITVARENSKEFITALRSMSSNSTTSMNNEKVMLPRLNSKNSIEVMRHSSRGTIHVERSNSKSKINIPRLDSKSMVISDPSQLKKSLQQQEHSVEPQPSAEQSPRNVFALDRIIVESDMTKSVLEVPPKRLRYFNLPKGPVTPSIAQTVLHVYKRGGFLNQKSAHKLLRLSYKILKSRRNITDVSVLDGVQLIIVGDIHGKYQFLLTCVLKFLIENLTTQVNCKTWFILLKKLAFQETQRSIYLMAISLIEEISE